MKQYRKDLTAFIPSCAHLTLLEEGVYNRLLDIYYAKERPIPGDIDAACRLCRAHTPEECAAVESVLREFFTLTDDGWKQARADKEIGRLAARADASRENGKKGGRPAAKPNKSPDPGPEMPDMGLASPAASAPYLVEPAKPKKAPGGRAATTFAKWCEEVRAKGEKFISDYAPVWEYAKKVNLPEEFVMLAFQVFKDRYTNGEKGKRKTYRDWRSAFLNCIKADWFHLWRVDPDGRYVLSNQGIQADLEHRRAA